VLSVLNHRTSDAVVAQHAGVMGPRHGLQEQSRCVLISPD
jgi:hypothetical protein